MKLAARRSAESAREEAPICKALEKLELWRTVNTVSGVVAVVHEV